jgi:hypothetical protein
MYYINLIYIYIAIDDMPIKHWEYETGARALAQHKPLEASASNEARGSIDASQHAARTPFQRISRNQKWLMMKQCKHPHKCLGKR